MPINYYFYGEMFTFSNMLDFRGRATRRELGVLALSYMIVLLILGYLFPETAILQLLFGGYLLLALMVRRVHDADSAWWVLLTLFVPLIGYGIVLYLLLRSGSYGENSYGRDPRGRTDDYLY
ncbi:MAG: DUF805 domain-containing protein [Pseudomonadota bacterium]